MHQTPENIHLLRAVVASGVAVVPLIAIKRCQERADNSWQRTEVIQIRKYNDHTQATYTLYWCLYIAIGLKVYCTV